MLKTFSYAQAIADVKSVMSKIQETKDPEGVLLKFASDKNYPVAALQTLAHAHNTVRTIAHISNNPKDRGAPVHVIDGVKLADRFKAMRPDGLKSKGHAKAASTISDEPTSTVGVYNEEEADAVFRRAFKLGDRPTMTKAASVPVSDPRSQLSKLRQEVDDIIAAEDADLGRCYSAVLRKVASSAKGGVWFREAETTLFGGDAHVKAASEGAAALLKRNGYTVLRASRGITRTFDDSQGIKDVLVKAASNLAAKKDALTYRADIDARLNELDKKAAEDTAHELGYGSLDELVKQATGWGSNGKIDKDTRSGHGFGEDGSRGGPYEGRLNTPAFQGTDKATLPQTEHDMFGAPTDSPEKPKDEKEKDDDKDGPKATQLVSDQLFQGIPKMEDNSNLSLNSSGIAEKLLGAVEVGGKGPQKQLDKSIGKARLSDDLSRLFISDPALRAAMERDPENVASLTSTILNLAPQLAKDPNVLRYYLRESLEYQGVPGASVGALTKAEKDVTDTKMRKDEMQDKRYGGAKSLDELVGLPLKL